MHKDSKGTWIIARSAVMAAAVGGLFTLAAAKEGRSASDGVDAVAEVGSRQSDEVAGETSGVVPASEAVAELSTSIPVGPTATAAVMTTVMPKPLPLDPMVLADEYPVAYTFHGDSGYCAKGAAID